MKDGICEPNPKVAVSCRPPSSLWRHRSTEKFQSQPKMASTTSQREISCRICYIFLCTSQVSKIGRTLRDGTRLLWIFQTVAMAGYFRSPWNSITTALHYESVNGSLMEPLLTCAMFAFWLPSTFSLLHQSVLSLTLQRSLQLRTFYPHYLDLIFFALNLQSNNSRISGVVLCFNFCPQAATSQSSQACHSYTYSRPDIFGNVQLSLMVSLCTMTN